MIKGSQKKEECNDEKMRKDMLVFGSVSITCEYESSNIKVFKGDEVYEMKVCSSPSFP